MGAEEARCYKGIEKWSKFDNSLRVQCEGKTNVWFTTAFACRSPTLIKEDIVN